MNGDSGSLRRWNCFQPPTLGLGGSGEPGLGLRGQPCGGKCCQGQTRPAPESQGGQQKPLQLAFSRLCLPDVPLHRQTLKFRTTLPSLPVAALGS